MQSVWHLSPAFMKDIFKEIERETRSGTSFLRPKVNSVKRGDRSLRSFGPIVWNTMLPDALKKCDTLDLFKHSIKTWKPDNCPCELCKVYIKGLGYTVVSQSGWLVWWHVCLGMCIVYLLVMWNIVNELFGDMQIDYEIFRGLGRLYLIYFVGYFEIMVVIKVAVVVEALWINIWIALLTRCQPFLRMYITILNNDSF